jgi:hypothetical protein
MPPIAAQEALRYRNTTLLSDAAGSREVALVRLRYEEPTGSESRLTEEAVVDRGSGIDPASESLRFAAAVASLGMLLRGSEDVTWPQAIRLGKGSSGADPDALRREFVTLVERARENAGAPGLGRRSGTERCRRGGAAPPRLNGDPSGTAGWGPGTWSNAYRASSVSVTPAIGE